MAYELPVTLIETDQDTYNGKLQNSVEALKVLHGVAMTGAQVFFHESNALKKRNAADSAAVVLFPNTEAVNGGLLALSGGTMTADIAMGGFKVTGLGAATANGQALRFEDMTRLEKQHFAIKNTDGMPSGSSATAEILGFTPNVAVTIVGAKIVFNQGAAYGGSNFHTLKLRNKGTSGSGTTDIVTKSLASVTVTAFASIDMGSVSNANVAAGETVVYRIENTATDPVLLTTAQAVLTVYFKPQ